jgi:hypothetical protein
VKVLLQHLLKQSLWPDGWLPGTPLPDFNIAGEEF